MMQSTCIYRPDLCSETSMHTFSGKAVVNVDSAQTVDGHAATIAAESNHAQIGMNRIGKVVW